MNFDIQRFADAIINPGATYTTGTTTPQGYTISTETAAPQIQDIESLPPSLQDLIAGGNATGKIGDVEVKVDEDGYISTDDSSVDLNSLIGETIIFDGSGEITTQTATVGNGSITTLNDDNGVIANGTVTLFASDDESYTTAYVVKTDANGAITSVTVNGEAANVSDLTDLSGLIEQAGNPATGNTNVDTESGHVDQDISPIDGDANSNGYHITVSDGVATYSKSGTDLSGNTDTVQTVTGYTATAGDISLEFDAAGNLTKVNDTEQTGSSFTVDGTTYNVTFDAAAGTGSLTTDGGSTQDVTFTATSVVADVTFDFNGNGTVD